VEEMQENDGKPVSVQEDRSGRKHTKTGTEAFVGVSRSDDLAAIVVFPVLLIVVYISNPLIFPETDFITIGGIRQHLKFIGRQLNRSKDRYSPIGILARCQPGRDIIGSGIASRHGRYPVAIFQHFPSITCGWSGTKLRFS